MKKEDKDMSSLIQLPSIKKTANLTNWLNNHAGCDVDKMINGDELELHKSLQHFNKETFKVRSRIKDDER